MKYLATFVITIALLLTPLGKLDNHQAANASTQPYSGYPTFSIASVVRDKTVTIRTRNLPSKDVFRVRMGYMGTRGINGIIVKSFETGSGGAKTLEFSIPSDLHGLYQISIRIESKTGSGYYAYNWFYNNTTAAKKTNAPKPPSGYKGYPTFSIAKVVRNQSVTINIKNLPPQDVFRVRMGYMGTRGVNGIIGDSFETGQGGSKQVTFNIPAKLKGLRQIAIRIESKAGSGYYAFNWFYNNTYP